MHKAFHFQMAVKSVTQEQGDVIIEGFASTPDIDRYRDIVEPSAFAKALTMFMKNPVLLRSHDPDRPAGKIIEAKITDKGLWIKAIVSEEETKRDVQEERMRAMSIGYIPLETDLQHEDGNPFNFETDSIWDADIVRVIKSLDLVEISIVTTPANGNALFSVAKSVKAYFNEVLTKNFMHKKNNENQTTPTAPVENQPPAPETPKPAAEVTPPTENGSDEEKETNEPAAVGTNQETTSEGSAPSEEAEKAGETPAADSGEAPKSEEPKAEAKPNEPTTSEESAKTIVLSKKTAEALPELIEAKIAVVDQEEKTTDLPGAVVGFVRKLLDLSLSQEKEISVLTEKLNKTPTKMALAATAQSTGPEDETSGAQAKKEPSPFFKQLFNLN